jgi:hypothetical protein
VALQYLSKSNFSLQALHMLATRRCGPTGMSQLMSHV